MLLPSLENLACFEAAARTLNFRTAARAVALSPAAFGQRIRQIEEQVGAPLFERTTRRVQLTPRGLALLPRARQCLALAEDCLRSAMRPAPAPVELTLGTRFELGMSWIVPQLGALTRRAPRADAPPLFRRLRRPAEAPPRPQRRLRRHQRTLERHEPRGGDAARGALRVRRLPQAAPARGVRQPGARVAALPARHRPDHAAVPGTSRIRRRRRRPLRVRAAPLGRARRRHQGAGPRRRGRRRAAAPHGRRRAPRRRKLEAAPAVTRPRARSFQARLPARRPAEPRSTRSSQSRCARCRSSRGARSPALAQSRVNGVDSPAEDHERSPRRQRAAPPRDPDHGAGHHRRTGPRAPRPLRHHGALRVRPRGRRSTEWRRTRTRGPSRSRATMSPSTWAARPGGRSTLRRPSSRPDPGARPCRGEVAVSGNVGVFAEGRARLVIRNGSVLGIQVSGSPPGRAASSICSICSVRRSRRRRRGDRHGVPVPQRRDLR